MRHSYRYTNCEHVYYFTIILFDIGIVLVFVSFQIDMFSMERDREKEDDRIYFCFRHFVTNNYAPRHVKIDKNFDSIFCQQVKIPEEVSYKLCS